eukprot:GFKZ01006591.1.p1 GENE.GFKZ01006591.1~~GFKZ01006591.1.p1  ORF type:complete len:227 (-),score=31.62 GFKZ01006591.1:188-868(-)
MIQLFVFFTASALFAIAQGAAVKDIPVTGRLSSAARAELRRKVAAAGGCNANICFAIDGSGSIPGQAFINERNFVLDVVAVLADNPIEVAAVQYATSVRTISGLTPDLASFNLAVNSERQLGGASFVVGGISACFSSLIRRRGEALKIVLLGDAGSNIGSSAPRRADLFRRVGGEVCAVAAGRANDRELLRIAGGDPNAVFDVDSFLDVLDLELIIEGLVLGICRH